jgi:hypothetical protein
MPQASRTKQTAAKDEQTRGNRPPRKSIAPANVRRIRADIEHKDLPKDWVATQADISFPTLSSLLSGRRINSEQLARVEAVVKAAPTPEEAR